MEYFLIAIIATIGLVLDNLWQPDDSAKRLKRLRTALVWAVILLVWILSWRQWHDASVSAKQTEFIRNRLSEATSSLSNMTAIATNMQAEITHFRKQSDLDQITLLENFLGPFITSPADREYTIGLFALTTGRNEDAKRHFKMALAWNPSHSKAHNNLAVIFNREGQKREAEDHIRTAFEFDTNNVAAAVNYAIILMASNQFDRAMAIVAGADGPVDDLDPQAALNWAGNLAPHGKSKFLKYLIRYVQFSESPKAVDVMAPLYSGWKTLSWDERTSVTNWYPLLPPSDRALLEGSLRSFNLPILLAENTGEDEKAEQHISDMNPSYALEWAQELARRLNPKFFKFLTFYVQSSRPPSAWDIEMPLSDGWRCLSSDERASVTNWYPLLSAQDCTSLQQRLGWCNYELLQFQEQDAQAQQVEKNITDLDPQVALKWAKELAWRPRNPRFLKFLNRYVQASPSPTFSDLIEPLHSGWKILSQEERASVTNWYPFLSPSTRTDLQQFLKLRPDSEPKPVSK